MSAPWHERPRHLKVEDFLIEDAPDTNWPATCTRRLAYALVAVIGLTIFGPALWAVLT